MKKVLLMFFVCALCFGSCNKETDLLTTKSNNIREISKDLDFGKYTKELTLYDISQKNSAVIKIGTDNLDYFNLLSNKTVFLIPIHKGQSTIEAINNFYEEMGLDVPEKTEQQISQEEPASSEEDGIYVYSMILTKSLCDDVENVVVLNLTPNPTKAGWIFDTSYGIAPTVGTNMGIQTAKFTGYNNWHVGYYGLDYVPLNINNDCIKIFKD